MSYMAELRASLSFFTRLPVGSWPQDMTLDKLTTHLPAVGIIVGLLVGTLLWVFTQFFPIPLSGLLAALAWVWLTGGLHLDGLADCADALVVEASKEKRLAIMKDPTVGTFAVIAVFFVLGIKVFTLMYLAQSLWAQSAYTGAVLGIVCICLTASLARIMVFVAHGAPHARKPMVQQGLGIAATKGITPAIKKKNAFFVSMWALAVWLFSYTAMPEGQGLAWYAVPLACISAFMATVYVVRRAKKAIGGVTGDVYGCVIELSECAALLALCVQ